MSEENEKQVGDPFSQMVQLYDDWTQNWAGAASEMVSSKSFADSMAQQSESALSATQMMRRQVSQLMEQSLQQMNLPSRKEILNIAQRLTNVEMRLDDMEAKLDEVLDLLKAGK
jgi:SMC interacting uncharacterized protein involved in chromosome segregation